MSGYCSCVVPFMLYPKVSSRLHLMNGPLLPPSHSSKVKAARVHVAVHHGNSHPCPICFASQSEDKERPAQCWGLEVSGGGRYLGKVGASKTVMFALKVCVEEIALLRSSREIREWEKQQQACHARNLLVEPLLSRGFDQFCFLSHLNN